jgi:hypothetical protein
MKTRCCHSKEYVVVDGRVICHNDQCSRFLLPASLRATRLAKYLVALVCFGLFFFRPYEDYCYSEKAYCLQNEFSLNTVQIPLTNENLRFEIARQQIFCPAEVYAQMQLESGRLNSFLAKRANNLLGMRYPFKRTTTAVGIFLPSQNKVILGSQEELLKYRNQNHYAVYASWQDCVKDYKLWQEECFRLSDRYLAFLGNYYAEDSHYIQKIRGFRD